MEFSGALQAADRWLYLLINRTLQNPGFDFLMPILSDKHAGLVLVVIAVPLLVARFGRRAWPPMLLAVAAVLLADQGATLLKDVIQRVRPCHLVPDPHLLSGCTGSFAMPSGHASNMFALAGVAWATRAGWRWPALLLALGVSYSRVYLGVHYPGDVLVGAGWGVGLGWALAKGAIRLAPGWVRDPARDRADGA